MSSQGSAEKFGFEWGTYSDLYPEYELQFLRWTAPFQRDDWRGKTFLDAGCGMGRNSYWPMRYGAAGGAAIDIDDQSLACARRNLTPFPTVNVVRASIYEIPFQDHFDIAFSIGVIHHLEHPEQALKSMVSAVKPGGQVLIWVYGWEHNRAFVILLNPLRKMLLSRLPIRLVHALSWIPAAGLWLFLRVGIGLDDYLRLLRKFKFAHLRSIVFDQMFPSISNYWPKDTVRRLMEEAGLEKVTLQSVSGRSWSAMGTRARPQ